MLADRSNSPELAQSQVEKWKVIPDFPCYRISNRGRVQSRYRPGGKGSMIRGFRNRKLSALPGGYLFLGLHHEKKTIQRYVHILVLEAFVGSKPDGMEARHLDGNPKNNKADNLCWGTHQENEADKKRHGTRMVGSKHCLAKLTEAEVLEMRTLWADGWLQKILAQRFHVSTGTVCQIVHRKHWKHI